VASRGRSCGRSARAGAKRGEPPFRTVAAVVAELLQSKVCTDAHLRNGEVPKWS
jgi:hypothetical protein